MTKIQNKKFKTLEFRILNLFRISNFEFRILILVFLAPILSYASIVPCGTSDNPQPCNVCYLFVGVHKIIKFLLYDIAAPLAVIILMYGGFKLITSQGNEEGLKKGKQAIWMAVWGMIIAFAAFLIIDTILLGLVSTEGGFHWPFGDSWSSIPSCG